MVASLLQVAAAQCFLSAGARRFFGFSDDLPMGILLGYFIFVTLLCTILDFPDYTMNVRCYEKLSMTFRPARSAKMKELADAWPVSLSTPRVLVTEKYHSED